MYSNWLGLHGRWGFHPEDPWGVLIENFFRDPNLGTLYSKELAETVTMADVIVKEVQQALADNATMADVYAKVWTAVKTFTEDVEMDDARVMAVSQALTDSLYMYEGTNFDFTPTDISGCLLWLRSDLGITKDGSDRVSLWEDQSGNGYDASQSLDEKKPLWEDAQLNGHPILTFDGTADFLAHTTIDIPGELPFTVFLVKKTNTWVTSDYVFGLFSTTANLGYIMFYGSPRYCMAADWVNSLYISTNDWVVNTMILQPSASGNTKIYDDGVVKIDASVNLTSAPPWNYGIGAHSNGGGPSNVSFAEVIIYNSALSDADRQTVERYLNSRYLETGYDVQMLVGKPVADNATLDDAIVSKGSGKVLADIIEANDALVNLIGKAITDNATLADAIFKLLSRTIADNTTMADVIANMPGKVLADNATLDDALVKGGGKVIADNATMNDAFSDIWNAVRTFTDGLYASDADTKLVSKSIADNTTLADIIRKSGSRLFADDITAADSIAKKPILTFPEGVEASDSQVISFSKAIADNATMADVRSQVWAAYKTFTDNIGISTKPIGDLIHESGSWAGHSRILIPGHFVLDSRPPWEDSLPTSEEWSTSSQTSGGWTEIEQDSGTWTSSSFTSGAWTEIEQGA